MSLLQKKPRLILLVVFRSLRFARSPSLGLVVAVADVFFFRRTVKTGTTSAGWGGHSPSRFQPLTQARMMSRRLMGQEGVKECVTILSYMPGYIAGVMEARMGLAGGRSGAGIGRRVSILC